MIFFVFRFEIASLLITKKFASLLDYRPLSYRLFLLLPTELSLIKLLSASYCLLVSGLKGLENLIKQQCSYLSFC
jgi:hypothetical protein